MTDGPSDDLDRVRAFQAGDERAFNELVLKYRRSVYMTALGMLGNHDDAEDAAQEVFIKVYKSLASFRGDSAFYTWIYRVTVNWCLNQIRRRKVMSVFGLEQVQASLPEALSADAPSESKEFDQRARKAIAELPEKQRAVFILRHFQRLPHAAIAEIMERDEGTIKANYFQAVRKLRGKLGPYVRGEE